MNHRHDQKEAQKVDDGSRAVTKSGKPRHYSEGNKGVLMVYNEKAECFTEATLYPYDEMYARIQRGQGAIGKES